MTATSETFTFTKAMASGVMVVSPVGHWTKNFSEIISQLEREILESQCKVVVLNMSGVQKHDRTISPTLAKLKKALREHAREFPICAVKPELRGFLVDQGLIAPSEGKEDLKTTLLEFVQKAA